MKMQLKLLLLLFGVSFIFLVGCKKPHDVATTITSSFTSSTPIKGGLFNTGTFVATGGLTTSGTDEMTIQFVGADSAHCTNKMTTPKGTFILIQDCSLPNMTGQWYITSGTGHYDDLRGYGSLKMLFPPDPSVPPGVVGIEAMTGVIY